MHIISVTVGYEILVVIYIKEGTAELGVQGMQIHLYSLARYGSKTCSFKRSYIITTC